MGHLNYIRRELDKARDAYNREQSKMLPLGESTEHWIINTLGLLIEELEGLSEPGERWVSSPGAVEIAADFIPPEDRAEDYEGEVIDVAWHDYPNPDTRLSE